MHIYKQISYIINLISDSKKTIIFLLILVNGFGFLYYKNLEKFYQADIIITAIPSKSSQSVDIFTIYEATFRDRENFENWIKSQNKESKDFQININEILGFQVDERQLFIYNKLVFRNAQPLQRSIYLTVPAGNQKNLKDIFLYSKYIGELLNAEDEIQRKKFNSQLWLNKLDLVLRNLKVNYTVDINSSTSENEESSEKFLTFLRTLTGQLKDLDLVDNTRNEAKALTEPSEALKTKPIVPLIVVTPPKSIYSNSLEFNKMLFTSIVLSIFLICVFLIYKDFKNSDRK
tara:strand:- start:4851 stop:5717 length:867 start_codon:yes stop_codon:yes gene_type:complete